MAAFTPSFDFVPDATYDQTLLQQLGFLPGLKELIMTRQIHALEHATVWVLSELTTSAPGSQRGTKADGLMGGMSTDQGFYLYGNVGASDLRYAAHTALRRIVNGEWNLAVHPQCGTNLSVAMVLTAGLAVGAHLLMPKGPLLQLLGLGVAATTAMQLAPDVGQLAQRHLTTAIPFNLAIDSITCQRDHWGRSVHFVKVRWVEDV